MSTIKELFSKNYRVLSQKKLADITGSATPVESSDYIEAFIEQKNRNLPAVDFATASLRDLVLLSSTLSIPLREFIIPTRMMVLSLRRLIG